MSGEPIAADRSRQGHHPSASFPRKLILDLGRARRRAGSWPDLWLLHVGGRHAPAGGVLPKSVASIVGKKISGKTYYYLVESARVGGKPRIVSQQYLGPADEVTARLAGSGPGEPERSRHLGFGDLAAVWGMLDRLGYAGIVGEVTGGRRSDAKAGVGTYLALAGANRVVSPRSKLAFAGWWSATAGARVTGVPWAALDHRRFWDAMDAVDDAALTGIVRRLAAAMVAEFSLELPSMALDMTNFATDADRRVMQMLAA